MSSPRLFYEPDSMATSTFMGSGPGCATQALRLVACSRVATLLVLRWRALGLVGVMGLGPTAGVGCGRKGMGLNSADGGGNEDC